MSFYAARQLDLAAYHPDAAVRAAAQARGDLLIPIVKGWSTETANEVAAIGVQVHGGMGFIEETGAAQYVRDVRITTIYEGTTGIQANDLIGRKIGRDRGAAMGALIADMRRELQALRARRAMRRGQTRDAALQGVGLMESATRSLVANIAAAPERALAVAVPYLQALRTGLGRLAARQVGCDCRRRARRGREGLLPVEDPHGALLREAGVAAGDRAGEGRRGRRGECGGGGAGAGLRPAGMAL